jgi:hypothetical protein
LIAEMNEAHTYRLEVPNPPSLVDLNRLAEAIRDVNRLRSREHGVHALVTSLLLRWLSQATGQPQCEILNRLALTIDSHLPPDEPGGTAQL